MLSWIYHSGSEPSLCRPKKQSRFQTSERLVRQYQAYCEESGFKALSRSTLLRILSICSASTCKSLQGLDYVSSTGTQAFEELLDVIEKIGDVGKGMDWAKDAQNRLRAGKRYLKGDYMASSITVLQSLAGLDTSINPDSSILNQHFRSLYYSPNSFYNLKRSLLIFHNNIRSLKRNLENLQTQLLNELVSQVAHVAPDKFQPLLYF